jgi:hypothetical protein
LRLKGKRLFDIPDNYLIKRTRGIDRPALDSF